MSTPPSSDPPSAPRSEELLEHAAFLRRLAARLVGPEEAGDLVQEAYARALATPPAARGALRGWLAVVVANLARNHHRSTARRVERERGVARPEWLDAHQESRQALERLELQRALSELVVALPDEQRTVLYLRYFEGETPSAIARRLGVPLKTVEARHTRGLARLRAGLDARSGGDREAWVGVLLAWTSDAGAPLALGSAVRGAAVLVLGFAGWGAWRLLSTERSPLAMAGPGEQAVVEVPLSSPPREASREPASEPRSASMSPPRARLVGHVRRIEDDSAVAGVTVRAFPFEDAVTDDEGAFAFEWPEAKELPWIEVLAGPVTAAGTDRHERRIELGETQELELVVSGGARLSGRVVDESGAPVSGARVLGTSGQRLSPCATPFRPVERSVETSADGSFTIEHLGEPFFLEAELSGLACAFGLRGKLAAGASVGGLELVLAPTRSFQGRIVDGLGRAVPGVRISFLGRGFESSEGRTSVPGVWRFDAGKLCGVSDDGGDFELGPFPRDSVTVELGRPGFLTSSATLFAGADNRLVLADRTPEAEPFRPPAGDELSVDTRQLDGLVFSGRVLDGRTGQPIRRFTLVAWSHEDPRWSGRTVSCDDPEGRFRLAGLPPGRTQLWASATGYAQRRLAEVDFLLGEVRQDIALFPACTVEFRLAPESEIGLVDLSFATLDGESVCPETESSSFCTLQVARERGSPATLPETWISVRAKPTGSQPFTFELDLTSPSGAPVILHPELDPSRGGSVSR